jgi:acylphosphatase
VSAALPAIRCLVSGRVQGVYFRAAAAAEASRLALRGFAKNLPDGRVEVVASGDLEALGELTAWLWRGPATARVDGVAVEQWDGPVPSDFTVAR